MIEIVLHGAPLAGKPQHRPNFCRIVRSSGDRCLPDRPGTIDGTTRRGDSVTDTATDEVIVVLLDDVTTRQTRQRRSRTSPRNTGTRATKVRQTRRTMADRPMTADDDLDDLDDLRRPGRPCRVAKILAALSEVSRANVETALAGDEAMYPSTKIASVIGHRVGVRVSPPTIRSHRRGECCCNVTATRRAGVDLTAAMSTHK